MWSRGSDAFGSRHPVSSKRVGNCGRNLYFDGKEMD